MYLPSLHRGPWNPKSQPVKQDPLTGLQVEELAQWPHFCSQFSPNISLSHSVKDRKKYVLDYCLSFKCTATLVIQYIFLKTNINIVKTCFDIGSKNNYY